MILKYILSKSGNQCVKIQMFKLEVNIALGQQTFPRKKSWKMYSNLSAHNETLIMSSLLIQTEYYMTLHICQ